MKNLAFAFLLFAVGSTFAQSIKESDVSTVLKSALTKAYPKAHSIKWSKEDGKFEASFELNKTEHSVVFESDGKIIQTEMEITANQVPKSVIDFVMKNYKGEKIKETAKITDASGVVTYEVEIKGKDLLFDEQGQLIKLIKN